MSAPTSQQVPALELRGVVKRFGHTVALDGVDVVVAMGQVHALLGENGAGKSTAMRIAYGLTAPDAGEVRIFDRQTRNHSVPGAIASGLGMVHQHLSLVPTLTAAESLVLGEKGLFDRVDAERRLRAVSESSGLKVDPGALVSNLSLVEQQRLEILKALARAARILILDEPTALLAPLEADELLRWLRRFANDGGSVVLVTHKLREAMAIADVVTVLRRGRVVLTGAAGDTSEKELASAMFPDPPPAGSGASSVPGAAVVRVEDADIRGARGLAISNASFELRRGEIVGVAAIEGSGHRELLAAIAGLTAPERGAIELPARIALIPANRARDAVVADFSLTENVALHDLAKRRGMMPWRAINDATEQLIEQFNIAAPSAGVSLRSLSGGNQQRLVVAREIEHDVDLLVADNPTRGLDLRASAFVHDQLLRAASRGAAVVLHSSDLDEVLALATRVVVVFHGQVRAVPLDREAISGAMVGAAA
jgi:ABC-type uncharacterized transport system ATPase subunit